MISRFFVIITISLFLCVTMNAQEKNPGVKTLFKVEYNNYGPEVRLYVKYGQLMKSQHGSGVRAHNNTFSLVKKGSGQKRVLNVDVNSYEQEVGDSVIDKIYKRLKQDVKRKKKEDKRWARQLKRQRKENETVLHQNGGTQLRVTIDIKDVRYTGSIAADEKDSQYAKWFWDEMLDIALEIAETRGDLPQTTIDELSENGKIKLNYDYDKRLMRFPPFWSE